MDDKLKPCPHCDYDLDGGSILEEFKKQRGQRLIWCTDMTDEQLEQLMKENYGQHTRWSKALTKTGGRISVTTCPSCHRVLTEL